ncbi:MAG: orotate phosphoribosyltransferase-like protein [Candidatus Thermoplasmatota archaeon]|jgi:orotate phosphoribosyltransferase|nr:orotate phosphoribosyltransferase-like protein [Euryarchaeota archaeon]MEC7100966.1 orotate phosphoribosyltransferase-like protein [Candidatus Thermoplasmatota archaeon]MEC9075942.1 orotate phosphoribosyltransferase-like protein [Candidatus Thermoplasmatota archaeon]MEC9146217.1 orotate phosphoribosyltransferase-like protein [Candidatus Thermoplasmatota archaeon]|tara:strand:+ start:22517 stop:23101 length:585 start_codon:yes stop_codon:yes gene_type:complete
MMTSSVDDLRTTVEEYRSKGLNTQQIADEMSLSQTTIKWLSSGGVGSEDRPEDIRVGWRSIAVKSGRIEAISYVFCDIMEEEIGDEVDTIVGISINGIAFAQAIGGQMDLDIAISRSISDDGEGHISEVFADVEGKRCVVVDDVLSGGTTMSKTVSNLRAAGADVKLCMVLANKSHRNHIEGVPLRGLVRVVTV